MTTTWPTNDREWARLNDAADVHHQMSKDLRAKAARTALKNHVGCNAALCPNGKCRATGECIDIAAARQHREISDRHEGIKIAGSTVFRIPDIESPPLAPDDPHGPCGCMLASCTGRADCRHGPEAAAQVAAERRRRGDVPVPNRTIIAFTGLAGSGKSTAAGHLTKYRGFERVRFAEPLKAMLRALGLTYDEVDGHLKETPSALLGGKTPRYAMQTLGTEWGREQIASDLWIRAWKAAVARLPAGVPVVVDDCRFPNEAAAIRELGGVIVHIVRPGAGTASVHASEQHELRADRTIHNTQEVRQLRAQVDIILSDLSWADRQAAS